jgi:hypothetical protein
MVVGSTLRLPRAAKKACNTGLVRRALTRPRDPPERQRQNEQFLAARRDISRSHHN